MDYAGAYCPTRRNLEEDGWWLTSRLAAQTGYLMKLPDNTIIRRLWWRGRSAR